MLSMVSACVELASKSLQACSLLFDDPYFAFGICRECFEGVAAAPKFGLGYIRKRRARAHSWDALPPFYSARQRATGPSVTLYSAKSQSLLSDNQREQKLKGNGRNACGTLRLPMFVQKLPEGARTASLVNASTQIGAVYAIIFHVVEYNKSLEERASVARSMQEMNEKRRLFKEEQQRKKAAAHAAENVHIGQLSAVVALVLFIFLWMWDEQTIELVVLAALAGGEMSAYLAEWGIIWFLVIVVLMQMLLWKAISVKDVAGPTPATLLPFGEKETDPSSGEEESSSSVSRMAERFYNALRGGTDHCRDGRNMVTFYTSSSFVSRIGLYERMNTMYNLGNVLGRMLCQWYKPHTAGLALSFGLVTFTFTFLCICSACPELLSRSLPAVPALWILPTTVGIFNLSVGLMSTGLFVQAHERAQAGK
eukprot:s575_g31.t1